MANIITVAGNLRHTFPYSPLLLLLLLLLHNSILLSRVLHQFSWGQQPSNNNNNIAEYNRLHVSKCNNQRKNFLWWWCWLSCETTTVVVRKNIKKLTKDVKKWFRKWEYRHLWRRIYIAPSLVYVSVCLCTIAGRINALFGLWVWPGTTKAHNIIYHFLSPEQDSRLLFSPCG